MPPGGGKTPDVVDWFEPQERIMAGATILIIGKRACGKSTLMFDLMETISGWTSFGLALSPTYDSRETFAKHMPRAFIDEQSPERVEAFLKLIQNRYEKSARSTVEPRQTYMLCDDTAFDTRFMRCKPLSEMFLNGRQFGCTCLVVLQYMMKVGPDLRGNADFVFVFWDNNTENQKKLHKFWFSMMSFDTFKDVFGKCTRDHGCIVIDVRRSNKARSWRECVFWYQARLPSELGSFMMCEPDFFRIGQYCMPDDIIERDANVEKVWRMGPDGNVFDVQSTNGRDSTTGVPPPSRPVLASAVVKRPLVIDEMEK
jgi:energy-coupling factor transporter ATP-binding protein EcfA2